MSWFPTQSLSRINPLPVQLETDGTMTITCPNCHAVAPIEGFKLAYDDDDECFCIVCERLFSLTDIDGEEEE